MDRVELVQVPDATFYEFNQDERLDDCIACSSNGETAMLRLVEDAESVSEIAADFTCYGNADFVFCSRLGCSCSSGSLLLF